MTSNNAESIERWMKPLPFGAFLALALFACFPQVLLGLESFYARDYGVLGYPNVSFQRECFWRGELPMWNPYSNCGQPFLAQWGTMALYPFSLIYLLLPLPWSLGFFCLAHVWLGGLGMYLLARRWTETNFAGAFAGVTFAFGGIMLSSFAWPNYLVTLGWMPFLVLLAERAWREGGRWIIGASLVGALQMLSGAPELILFTWLITGVLCLCDATRASVSGLRFLGRVALMALLTAALTAAQLIPFFELLQQSHRDTAFATAKWQLPTWGWANFLVPLYNAFETPAGQFYQYDQGFLSSVYLGAIPVVFALLAVFRWPDVRVWVLSAVAILSVLFAFGDQTPVYGVIRKIVPLVGVARYPVKFLFVLAFVVPLLAGCGLAAVIKSRLSKGVWATTLFVLVAMMLIAWAAHGQRFVSYGAWPENFRDNVGYSWTKALPGNALPDGILNTLARLGGMVLGVFLLVAAIRLQRAPVLLAVAALGVVIADGRFHTPRQNPTLPAQLFTRRYWPEDLPEPKPGEARVFITPQAEEFLTFLSSTNTQRVWEFKRRAEWSSLNLLDRVPKVNGSSTLQTREERLVEQTLYAMTNRLPAALLDFLGAKWITSSNSPAQWSPRATALPFLTAGQQPVFMDEAPALAAMMESSFDFQQRVLVPPALRRALASSNAATAFVTNLMVTAKTIDAEIIASNATIAVIAQSFYPAWQATVDGRDVPLLQANVAFQAVSIPAGQHRLRLTYSDFNFRAGAAISAAALLLCIVAWLRIGRLRRA